MDKTIENRIEKIIGKNVELQNSIKDTSDFMAINRGDVLVLNDKYYLVTGTESEAGVGLDGEPKFWVKRAVDLETEALKIIKLVYFEKCYDTFGDMKIEFYRSPQKEAFVLDLVQEHSHFMHGFPVTDEKGNNVRIIERIKGQSLNRHIQDLNVNYETYFQQYLPAYLQQLLPCFLAMAFLHQHDQVHGDVRWDHIYIDQDSGLFRWIDFDYTYYFPENPFSFDLFGLGKILASVIGKGTISYFDLANKAEFKKRHLALYYEDFSLIEKHRFMNLKKIYPIIPESLNNVLLHFSGYSSVFYETVEEFLDDLQDALQNMKMNQFLYQ